MGMVAQKARKAGPTRATRNLGNCKAGDTQLEILSSHLRAQPAQQSHAEEGGGGTRGELFTIYATGMMHALTSAIPTEERDTHV